MKTISFIICLFLGSSTLLLGQKTIPTAPTKLAATVASTSRINLTWVDNATNETGFEIERSTNGTSFTKIATAGENVTTYANTGLSQDTKYYYRVRAVNTTGESAYTNIADATTLSRAPIAPTELTAQTVAVTQINLAWKDNATSETEFEIERSTNGTSFAKIATVGANVTTYQNSGLNQETKYYYRVRAVDVNIDIGTFYSAYSNIDDATTLTFTPIAPSDLTAQATSTSQINLVWKDNSSNESGFEIERSTNGTAFTKIADAGPNTTAFSNTGLPASTKYYYRVRAVNKDYPSAYSNTADATTLSVIPDAPTNLVATAISISQINLAWKDNATNETDFEIERSPDGNAFTKIATVTANVVTYQNTGLTENTKYYYRVRAYNKAGGTYSGYSNTADGTTLGNSINAPSDLTLTPLLADNMNNVRLSWKDNSNDETGFEVESSTNGTTFTKATTTAANVTQYEIFLTTSTKNYFRVRAIKGAVVSGYTNIVDYDMGPESPLDLKATVVSSSQINLSWVDRSIDETGYELERSGDGVSFSKIATLGANVVSYSDVGLSANTVYYYRVRGMKGSAGSAYAHIVSAKTLIASPPTAPIINASLSQNWTKNSDRVTEITAVWQDKSDNETGFDIQWGETDQYTGGSASTGANTTQYKIEGSWLGCGQKVYVRVRAKNANGESAWSSTIVTTSIALPEPPSNVVATTKSDSEIELKWGGANESYSRESRFVIQYSTSNSFTSPTEVQSDQNTDSKTIGGLGANTTYYFRIKTQNCAGESAWSSTVSAKTQETPVQAPAAPTNLVATAISISQINLVWKDNAINETDFEIERSTDGNTFAKIATVSANVITYENTGLTENTKYYYRVRAYNKAGGTYSGYSNTADATTLPPALKIPDAPKNLTAVAASSSQINLTWEDAATNETGFEIEQSLDGRAFTKIADVGANTTAYQNTGLIVSTRYYYRVRSVNSAGASTYSNTADAITLPPPVKIPDAPKNLTALATSSSQINLLWEDAATNETGFELERSTDGTNFTKIADLGANTTTYQNTGLVASTRYYYRVRSVNSAGASTYSNIANTTTPSNLGAPSNLVATAIGNTASLVWTDNASIETGFELERSINGGDFEKIGSLAANSTTYKDEHLRAQSRYAYRVRTVNGSANSVYSNIATVTIIITSLPTNTSEGLLYPNPVQSRVIVNMGSSGQRWQVTVRDASGKVVQESQQEVTGHAIDLSVESLPTGIYFLDATNPAQRRIFRFVKQ